MWNVPSCNQYMMNEGGLFAEVLFGPNGRSVICWFWACWNQCSALSGSIVLQMSNLVLTRVQRPALCSCLILAAEQSVVNHWFMYRKKHGFCLHKRKHLEFFFLLPLMQKTVLNVPIVLVSLIPVRQVCLKVYIVSTGSQSLLGMCYLNHQMRFDI